MGTKRIRTGDEISAIRNVTAAIAALLAGCAAGGAQVGASAGIRIAVAIGGVVGLAGALVLSIVELRVRRSDAEARSTENALRAIELERLRIELEQMKTRGSFQQAALIEGVLRRGPEAIEAIYRELGDESDEDAAGRAYPQHKHEEDELRDRIDTLARSGRTDGAAIDTPRLIDDLVDRLVRESKEDSLDTRGRGVVQNDDVASEAEARRELAEHHGHGVLRRVLAGGRRLARRSRATLVRSAGAALLLVGSAAVWLGAGPSQDPVAAEGRGSHGLAPLRAATQSPSAIAALRLATKTLAVSCSAQEPSPTRSYLHLADAIAFVSCDPVGSGAATLAAYEFRDEDQVERAMGDFVQAIPVPSGPCDGGMGNTIWSSRDTRPGGLILCAIEVSSRGGTPYVVWSEPATHRLFYVTGPTGASNGLNDLEVWWSTWVRPQQAKRTDDEHRLLATIGRRLDTDHCRRDPLGGAPNAIASMVCAPVRRRDGSRTGASYAFFERFASPQALAGYFAAVVRAEAHGARDEPSRGCDTVGVEIDSWSARGRRLCWSVNGDARIGWTTDADLTYGELRRGDGNRFALFATWSQAAE